MKSLVMAGGLMLAMTQVAAAQERPVIDVIKQATCGCCSGWVAAMQKAGFALNVRDVSGEELDAAKQASGLSQDLWGCHTASVAGYTIEGHVPAREILRLLDERPAALGLATPGMPLGAPGMEADGRSDAYDVIFVGLDRNQKVYASYPGN